jgi:agmatinase
MIKMNTAAFMGRQQELGMSKVIILPVPYEQTTCYGKGTVRGPEAIIAASRMVELFDDELGMETYKAGMHTLQPAVLGVDSPEKMDSDLYKQASALVRKRRLLVSLGGEHSISYALVMAHAKSFKNLSVLQVDAHADLWPRYQGSPYSHASVMYRVTRKFPAVQVGIRSISLTETKLIIREKLNVLNARDIDLQDDSWMDKAIEGLTENVYLTIDLDGLDPSIMPSVGTPEPDGLSYRQVVKLLQKLALSKKIVGIDVVELCPNPSVPGPDFISAKLIYKIIGYTLNPDKIRPIS